MIIDLDFFGDILRRELADSCTSEPVVADFEAKKEQIQAEAVRIEKALFQLLLSDLPDSDVMRRVHGLQSYTTWMADEALRWLEGSDARSVEGTEHEGATCGLARLLCRIMCGLLSYMEKCFGSHFDAHAEVPRCYATSLSDELEIAVATFAVDYRKKHGDEMLLTVILGVLNPTVKQPAGGRITFAKASYLRTVVEALVQEVREAEDEVTGAVVGRLLYLNFNAPAFVDYYTRRIRDDIGQIDCAVKRADRLAYYRKTVSQLQPRPGHGFDQRHMPCIKSQLVHWISEELAYEERRQLSGASVMDSSSAEFKVAMDVSVAHLAAICRVLIRSGSVKTTSVTEFIGFVAEHVTTPHREQVSKASLRNKYYEQGDESALLVASWLDSLSTRIRGWS